MNTVACQFGNLNNPFIKKENESISLFWLHCIRASRDGYNGDATLFINGKAVRYMLNADVKILNKSVQCTYEVIKPKK